MGILNVIMQVALIFVSLLLIGVILLQRNKGAGAGVSFGMGEAVFGADMGNVLTRTTIVLGVIFLLLVIGLSLLPYNKSSNVSVMAGPGTPAPAQVAEPVLPAADSSLPDEAAAVPRYCSSSSWYCVPIKAYNGCPAGMLIIPRCTGFGHQGEACMPVSAHTVSVTCIWQ